MVTFISIYSTCGIKQCTSLPRKFDSHIENSDYILSCSKVPLVGNDRFSPSLPSLVKSEASRVKTLTMCNAKYLVFKSI